MSDKEKIDLTDDEKIELIQQRLKNTKFSQQYTNAPKISLSYILDMETLLELYQKEKEKNKKIKNARLYVVGRRTGKEAEQKIYLKEYISKDKIKERIKELEEKSDYWNCDEIEVLKELLEEN